MTKKTRRELKDEIEELKATIQHQTYLIEGQTRSAIKLHERFLELRQFLEIDIESLKSMAIKGTNGEEEPYPAAHLYWCRSMLSQMDLIYTGGLETMQKKWGSGR